MAKIDQNLKINLMPRNLSFKSVGGFLLKSETYFFVMSFN